MQINSRWLYSLLTLIVLAVIIGVAVYSTKNMQPVETAQTATTTSAQKTVSASCAQPVIGLIPKEAKLIAAGTSMGDHYAAPETADPKSFDTLFEIFESGSAKDVTYSIEYKESKTSFFFVQDNKYITTNAGWGSFGFTIVAKAACGSVASKQMWVDLEKGPNPTYGEV